MLKRLPILISAIVTLSGAVAFASPFPEGLLERLASEEFGEREKAEAELTEWGKMDMQVSVPALLDVIRTSDDPEVSTRCLEALRVLSAEAYLKEEGASGYLGVGIDRGGSMVPDSDPPVFGVGITRAEADSPAGIGGIKVGDIVVALEGKTFPNMQLAPSALQAAVQIQRPGTKIAVRVWREGAFHDLSVTLGRRPFIPEMMDYFDTRTPDELEEEDRERFFQKWLLENRPVE